MKKGETVKTLLRNKKITIKKIASPKGFASKVFIQDRDEWCSLLTGSAKLKVGKKTISLFSGKSVFIPKKTKHQILSTSLKSQTIWLAVYF